MQVVQICFLIFKNLEFYKFLTDFMVTQKTALMAIDYGCHACSSLYSAVHKIPIVKYT